MLQLSKKLFVLQALKIIGLAYFHYDLNSLKVFLHKALMLIENDHSQSSKKKNNLLSAL